MHSKILKKPILLYLYLLYIAEFKLKKILSLSFQDHIHFTL